METCDHKGFHSGQGRYDPDTHTLRYVVVCDACREELRLVEVQQYVPAFNPRGNDAHRAA